MVIQDNVTLRWIEEAEPEQWKSQPPRGHICDLLDSPKQLFSFKTFFSEFAH